MGEECTLEGASTPRWRPSLTDTRIHLPGSYGSKKGLGERQWVTESLQQVMALRIVSVLEQISRNAATWDDGIFLQTKKMPEEGLLVLWRGDSLTVCIRSPWQTLLLDCTLIPGESEALGSHAHPQACTRGSIGS